MRSARRSRRTAGAWLVLAALWVAPVGAAAQDESEVPAGDCSAYGADFQVVADPLEGDGFGCAYPTLPGDDFTLLGGPAVVDTWYVVDDAIDDLVTVTGTAAQPDDGSADITRFLWRVAPYTREFDRFLKKEHPAGSPGSARGTGKALKPGTRTVWYHIDLRKPPTKQGPGRTVVGGIAGDPDGRPQNDWPARSDRPLDPLAGTQRFTQAGWFSNGDFAMGTTDVGKVKPGQGIPYYNVPARGAAFIDQGGISGFLPATDVGAFMRPWVQTTQPSAGDASVAEAAYDLVGRPWQGALTPIDGVVGAPETCGSIFLARDAQVDGETVDRALLVTIRSPELEGLAAAIVSVALKPGGTVDISPSEQQALAGSGAWDVLVPLPDETRVYLDSINAGPETDFDQDGDVDADDARILDQIHREARELLRREGVGRIDTGGAPGYVYGDPSCGRLPVDACDLIPGPEVEQALGLEAGQLDLRSGVSNDGRIRFCQGSAEGSGFPVPVVGANLSDRRLTPLTFEEVAAGLGIAPECTRSQFEVSGDPAYLIECRDPYLGAVISYLSVPKVGLYTFIRQEDPDLAFTRTLIQTMADYGYRKLSELALPTVY